MRIRYINVEDESLRRMEMEKMLLEKKQKPFQFDYERFSAIKKDQVILENYDIQKLGPGAVACYLSHMGCIEEELRKTSPLVILEDDIELSDDFFRLSDQLNNSEYDIIFLAVTFGKNIETYRQIVKLQRSVHLLDLYNIGFAGTYGYFIPEGKKYKILQTLQLGIKDKIISTPIDLHYASQSHSMKIRAAVLVPYFLKLNKYSSESSIGGSNTSQSILDIITNSLYTNISYQDLLSDSCSKLGLEENELIRLGLAEAIKPFLQDLTFR